MRFLFWRALAVASVFLWIDEAAAQTAATEPAPPFPELFREAERQAPRLRELAASVDAAEGHARQATAWANPIAGVEVEDVSGSGPYRGSSQAQTTFSISEPLELGGQRGARIAAGQAGLRSAQAHRNEARLAFAYELALAYAQAEAAQARVTVLTEDLGRAQEDDRSARAQVTAGKEADLRSVQATAASATAQAELDAGQAELIGALARLSSLAGSPQTYSAVAPSLLDMRRRVEAGTGNAIEPIESPSVQTAIAERDVAERRLVVEQKRGIPTPSVSVGMRRFAGDDASAWVFGVSVPLPLFDRNRGEIAAARADLAAAQAREEATRLETAASFRAAASLARAAESRRAAADQAEAAAREAYRLVRIGYDAGRTPLIELLSARRALTDAQSRALDARVSRVTAEASLARLAGRIPFVE